MFRYALMLVALGLSPLICQAESVDFELEPLGTQYGSPVGDSPGNVVLMQNDIRMSVENFTEGAFTGFNFSEIAVPPGSFFPAAVNPTQALTINNINARFDFTSLAFPVQFVSFQFSDQGGTENFEINSTGRKEVPVLIGGGLSHPEFLVNVSKGIAPGEEIGVVEISATAGIPIESLLIGGQELTIDNIRALGEPQSKWSQPIGFGTNGQIIGFGRPSNHIGNQIMADDFLSDGRPIMALRWWGSYEREGPGVPGTSPRPSGSSGPFDISFHESTGGHPDSLPVPGQPLVLHSGLIAKEIFVGADRGGEYVYRYDAVLPEPFREMAGVEYFLDIDKPSRTEFWSWHDADVPNPTLDFAAIATPPRHDGPWITFSPPGTDLAFELLVHCGDFNGDGEIDKLDVNLLTHEIRASTNNIAFDLNSDGLVNSTDLEHWVNICKYTCYGDANLDGEFNLSDFVLVFQSGKYETAMAACWDEGDWDGDGLFTTGDFVIAFQAGWYEQGPRPPLVAVPEPSGGFVLLLGLVAMVGPKRLTRPTRCRIGESRSGNASRSKPVCNP